MAVNQDLIELIPTLPLINNPEDINEATRIEEDLGLHGYHARRFIFRYADMFSVDISAFDFDKYFTKEIPLYNVISKLPSFLKRKNRSLTLGDLEQAINYGRLNDTIIKEIAANTTNDIPHKKLKMSASSEYKPEEVLIIILVGIALSLFLGWIAIQT